MSAFFRSPELEERFGRDGFVKVPLLSPAEVEALLAGYQTVRGQHEAIGIPYITTSHSSDAALISRVDDMLQAVMAPAIDRVLCDYKLLFGNFLVKMPGEGSRTDPHQDITFVDESRFASVNVWVALQDTTRQNGCMYFLKGSHRFMPTLRPTHSYPWAYAQVAHDIPAHAHVYEARAGEAFIFHHGVIHGSFANQSGQPRLAAVMAAYQSEADLLHYYLPPGERTKVQRYAMTKEAFLHFVKEQPPAKGVWQGEEEFAFPQVGQKEWHRLLGKKTPKKSFAARLAGWFNPQTAGTHG